MKFYKVNKTSDQKQVVTKNLKTGKYRQTNTLIANELFTEKELTRRLNLDKKLHSEFIEKHFTVIEHNSKLTHWFFGSRRQNVLND